MTAAAASIGNTTGFTCTLATVSTAASNTAVGHQAGLSLTTASNCTLVGAGAGDALTTGAANTLIGRNAGGAINSGSDSVIIGNGAGTALTTASESTIIGSESCPSATGGQNCTLGRYTLFSLVAGLGNVAVGLNAGFNLGAGGAASSNSNTIIGPNAGRYRGSGTDTLTTANSSVFIGSQARANGDSQTNQVVIAGTNGLGDGSNTTVIGSTATTQARLQGGTFLSTGANGQSTQLGQSTTLLSGLTGATVTATNLIPANCILLGVTARVTTAITGATTFDIGDGVTADRFGNDVAIALNTTSNQVIAPAAFAAANNVVLTANGSNFTGGAVRLTAHFMTLVAPTS
jgi:hypothetical protein